MTISCDSAPIARATSRAYSSSLNARSLNATEKVCSGRSIILAMIAAIALLSMPPERNMPERHVAHQPQPHRLLEQSRNGPTVSVSWLRADGCRTGRGTSQYCSRRDRAALEDKHMAGQQL